ncbi:MAG: DMT family transporter [Alphaproteobacteria bacterium]
MVPPASASPSNRLLPIAMLALIGLLWGLFYVLIKTGVTGGVAPMNYLFWFALIAGTVLLAIGRVRGAWPRARRVHLAFYFKAALVRFTFANIILYTVQGKLPIGIMAVLMAFVPIFTHGFSLAFRIERPEGRRIFGILMGLAGVLVIVGPKDGLPDPALAVWVLIGLGAPLLHGLGYVMLSEKNRPPDTDSLSIACGTLYATAVMILPLAITFGDFRFVLPPFSTGELAMMTHAVLAAFNFYAIFELIRISGPTYMSQANFLAVLFGVIFGMVIFDEVHSLYVWAAMALIVAGVALVNLRRKK